MLAEAGQIDSDHVLGWLTDIAKLQYRFVCRVGLVYLAAESLNLERIIGPDLSHAARGFVRHHVAEGPSVENEEHGFGIVHMGRNQKVVADAIDWGPFCHFRRDVAVFWQSRGSWSCGTLLRDRFFLDLGSFHALGPLLL